MEQKLAFITLGVKNLNISLKFYKNIFGWELSEISNEYLKVFELNGFYLALYSREELANDATVDNFGDGFKGFTLSHNVKSEQAVDDLISKLRNIGVKIVKEPQKVIWGGYSSYIADPDGNLWEIAYNPYLKND